LISTGTIYELNVIKNQIIVILKKSEVSYFNLQDFSILKIFKIDFSKNETPIMYICYILYFICAFYSLKDLQYKIEVIAHNQLHKPIYLANTYEPMVEKYNRFFD